MITLIVVCLLLVITTLIFLRQPQFGALPTGERLEEIEKADNYRDGQFHNLSYTPDLPEGVSYWDVTKKFLLAPKIDIRPKTQLPTVKTDLHRLHPDEQVLVWFGHSSYFMQVAGKKILVDPVFSGAASPLPFGVRAFPGTDGYTGEDIPEIDLLFISHDHWDHLDYATVKALRPKIKMVICGLGVGAHLERWGYPPGKIIETSWYQKSELPDGVTIHTMPARHFSGRGFARNKSLWVSYVLQTPSLQIYIGGDSGYDSHFATIGETFGAFDLAILENGQYDEHWPNIHMLPDEILKAAHDLNARRILPVHAAKFALANHPWYEPLELVYNHNEREPFDFLTPRIGEKVMLNNENQTFDRWWETMQ